MLWCALAILHGCDGQNDDDDCPRDRRQMCRWNAETDRYDRDCVYSGGVTNVWNRCLSAPASYRQRPDAGPCGSDGSTYFSNDPRCE
jgi:hypothetical protein